MSDRGLYELKRNHRQVSTVLYVGISPIGSYHTIEIVRSLNAATD